MPSPSSPSTRSAVLGFSLLASAACVAWLIRSRDSQRGIEMVGISGELRDLYAKRLVRDQPRQPKLGEPGFPPPLVREPIDEATAKLLFPPIGNSFVFDPLFYYRRPSNLALPIKLPEYPGGLYVIHSNSLGMREDSEPLATPPDWRVLVSGASNVECVCENQFSATNVLETLLRQRNPDKTIETLNTGAGGYSPYNDLAVLEHYRSIDPDVFVVILYGGNDFFGCVRLQRYFHHRDLPKEWPHLNTGLEECDKFTRDIGGTEVSQITYFLNNPDDIDIAVGTACSITAEMERLCREDKIRFVCAYVPPPLLGQPELLGDVRATVMERMHLTAEDLALSDRLADQWLAFLAERKIAHIDLRPTFRASKERLYWLTDTHINLVGQQIIAQALLPLVQASE